LQVLETLTVQDLPESRYELIVVDNGCTDGSSEAARERFGKVSNLRLVQEPQLGVSQARNTGVRACDSPIAAFIDDDALAPRDWLACLLRRFEQLDPMTACVGGDMEPIFEGERPEWLTDPLLRPLSAGLMWPGGPKFVEAPEGLCEVNSAYLIEPLLRFGGFPTDLGRVGDNLMSGDNIVNAVMAHAGHLFFYDPAIVVKHQVPASRMTRAWFRRRAFWQGISHWAAREYLLERGVPDRLSRPLDVPCAAAEWVEAFDEHLGDDDFVRTLTSIEHLGYLLASQRLIGGR
jgi:glycosyltransferase involved in cell wall biosynthesis